MATRMKYGKRFRSSAVSVGRPFISTMPSWRIQTMSRERRMFNASEVHSKKKHVAMPQFSFDTEATEDMSKKRENAEARMIERLTKAIALIESGLVELAAVPNPNRSFKNRVNQQAVMKVLRSLCLSCAPPLQLAHFEAASELHHQHVKMKLEEMPICFVCGGPARLEYEHESYCVDCYPDVPPRAGHQARIREMEREADKMRRSINRLDNHIRKTEHDDDAEGHG